MSRCPRPGGLSDGDDEVSRVPGKPTRTHATRSDPGEGAASTASETRRDNLPSNARRRPSQTMHFGAQSRGLRAPCERFAPGVSPGPRITRFRLAADLGRMGLVTHRVSNKVSKITSRHLVPLDRAFPAHALVHESSRARTRPTDRIFTGRCDMTLVGIWSAWAAIASDHVFGHVEGLGGRAGCPRSRRWHARPPTAGTLRSRIPFFGVLKHKPFMFSVLRSHSRQARRTRSGRAWLHHARRCRVAVTASRTARRVVDMNRDVGFGRDQTRDAVGA